MRFSLFLSIILHIAVALLLIYGIPFERKELDDRFAITVDMVDVSELSNLRNAVKSKPKTKVQEEVKTLPKAAQQQQKPAEEPQATKPDQPKEEVKPEVKPQPAPENAEAIPDKKAPPIKKPEVKKAVESKPTSPKKKEKPKPKEDSFAKDILKTLEASKNSKPVEKKKIEKQEEEKEADTIEAQTNREYNPNAELSLSEKDRVKSEIKKNWNTTAFSGSKEAAMRVKVIVKLDPLGNIVSVTPQTSSSSNSSYPAFTSSVVRAIKMTDFPSILKPENYHAWDELELNFDSSGMVY